MGRRTILWGREENYDCNCLTRKKPKNATGTYNMLAGPGREKSFDTTGRTKGGGGYGRGKKKGVLASEGGTPKPGKPHARSVKEGPVGREKRGRSRRSRGGKGTCLLAGRKKVWVIDGCTSLHSRKVGKKEEGT